MELISVTKENLEKEHICCAISNNKDCQVISKKAWMEQRFDEGLVFLKANVRGKCFIEYVPAEYAWTPIEADNYMYINCLWVSGQFKGQGYSNLLLEECMKDAKEKGKKGVVILSSKKKMGFLSDYKYLVYKGFEEVDFVEPYFVLMCMSFDQTAKKPQFKEVLKSKEKKSEKKDGFVLYYTSQCPFTAKYVPLLKQIADERNVKMETIHIKTAVDAKNVPSPFTTFALFYNGEFITHEILSEKKFEMLLESKGY